MSKLVTIGYTDYYGNEPVRVTVLSYDNNKYAKVQLPSGLIDEIKTGYIYADLAMTRQIAEINWHILGGGKRNTYRARVSHSEFCVYSENKARDINKLRSKRQAVTVATRLARALGHPVEVSATVSKGRSMTWGHLTVTCYPDGQAVQYKSSRRNQDGFIIGSYLRGFGKIVRTRTRRRT
jgi:hypothetical protein